MPWAIDPQETPVNEAFPMRGFRNTEIMPVSLVELERKFCSLLDLSCPIVELPFVQSWMLFKVCFASAHEFDRC
jgi:hypothetical protein